MQGKSKTWLMLLTAVLLASLVLLPSVIAEPQPKTIFVPDDYLDIQTAINHANNGDTVFVRAGTYQYNEQNSFLARAHSGNPNFGITVNKSISLIGENRRAVISMDWQQGTVYTLIIESDNVTFSGFTVTSNVGFKLGAGIRSLAILGSNCNIFNNTFQKCLIGSGQNQNISNCTFEGSDNFGMSVRFSNSVIANNYISRNRIGGIAVGVGSNVTIRDNNIVNNGPAFYGQNAPDIVGAGIRFIYHSQDVVENVNICYNNISGQGFGIEFSGAVSNSLIYCNNITNNDVGINLGNLPLRRYSQVGMGTKIFSNNLIDNTRNAYVEKEYPFNLTFDMSYNHVTGNTTDVVIWYNGDVGNYWSDYGGSGLYAIDQNNVDRHPQTHPVDTSAEVSMPNSFLAESWILPLIIGVVVIVLVMISFLVYSRHRKTVNLSP